MRSPIVEATSMNTAAMRTPNTKRSAKPSERAGTTDSAPGAGSTRSPAIPGRPRRLEPVLNLERVLRICPLVY